MAETIISGSPHCVNHTPHDTNLIKQLDGSTDVVRPVKGWIPNADGDVVIKNSIGTSVTVYGCKAGSVYAWPTTRILATGTTATSFTVALGEQYPN